MERIGIPVVQEKSARLERELAKLRQQQSQQDVRAAVSMRRMSISVSPAFSFVLRDAGSDGSLPLHIAECGWGARVSRARSLGQHQPGRRSRRCCGHFGLCDLWV